MLPPLTLLQYEAHIESGTIDADSLASQNLRRRQMDRRLFRTEPPGNTAGPTTPVAELANLRANVGKASSFTVFVEVRRSTSATSVDKILGKTCVPYPETTTFHGELSHCMLHVETCADQRLSFETICD